MSPSEVCIGFYAYDAWSLNVATPGTGSFACCISGQVKNLSFQAVQTIILAHFRVLQQAPLTTYNGIHH